MCIRDRYSVQGQRLVAHAHDVAIRGRGGHGQALGQGRRIDGQRVVADDSVRRRQVGEDVRPGMRDAHGLAVHDLLGADDVAAVGGADGLVAQAHAQDRLLAGEGLDDGHRDAGLGRRARAGRHADAVGVERGDLFQGDLVVARHAHVLAQFTEVLDQVVGKRVVVVDHQQHFFLQAGRRAARGGHWGRRASQMGSSRPCWTCSAARSTARALASVSAHSASGLESATMPAAACTYSVPSLMTPVRMAIATSISPP